jgi:hypothetical protein
MDERKKRQDKVMERTLSKRRRKRGTKKKSEDNQFNQRRRRKKAETKRRESFIIIEFCERKDKEFELVLFVPLLLFFVIQTTLSRFFVFRSSLVYKKMFKTNKNRL